MGTADLTSQVIFYALCVAVVAFCTMAYFIMGPFKNLRRGERVVVAFGIIGAIITIVAAAVQLLFRFLI